jgi:hypothetical protein
MDFDYKLFNFYCSMEELSNYETYELYYLKLTQSKLLYSSSPNLDVYAHGKTIYPNL